METRRRRRVDRKTVVEKKEEEGVEYEVKVNKSMDDNVYMNADTLRSSDGRESQGTRCQDRRAGRITSRPLTTANVVKHFEAVGLDSEFSQHNRIRDLSGGQKVRRFVSTFLCYENSRHYFKTKSGQDSRCFFFLLSFILYPTRTLSRFLVHALGHSLIIILDEPHSDRDALGALSNAISGKYECALPSHLHSSSNTFLRFRRWSVDHAQPGVR